MKTIENILGRKLYSWEEKFVEVHGEFCAPEILAEIFWSALAKLFIHRLEEKIGRKLTQEEKGNIYKYVQKGISYVKIESAMCRKVGVAEDKDLNFEM